MNTAVAENMDGMELWMNPLAKAVKAYALKLASKAARTQENYNMVLNKFMAYMDGKELNEQTVLEYARSIGENRGTGAARLHLSVLRQFLAWMAAKKYTDANLGYDIELPKTDAGSKRDALTPDQAAAVLDGIDIETITGKRDYAIMLLMLFNGLRVKEVAAIDKGDLRGDLLYVWGKGHSEKDDYVVIADEAKAAMEDYLAARQQDEGRALEDGAPVFVCDGNRAKGQRLTSDSVSRLAKAAIRAAGLDSHRLSAHSCRHTMVTEALKGGATLREVQMAARHANIATTMIYAHEIDKKANKSSALAASSIGAARERRAAK